MRLVLAMTALVIACGVASAQEPAPAVAGEFTPPQAYPESRYEAMWGKNPFTLKTAPAAVENISFAKDLAIGSHYGDAENPTIVIVNTKTHERTRLRQGETASNGMKLVSVKIGATRKETTVEVTLGSETTELTYNSEYLSQVAATKATKSPAPGARPGPVPIPGAPNVPQLQQGQQRGPGPPGTIRLPTGPAGMNRPSGGLPPSARPGGVAMGGMPAASTPAASTPGAVNVGVTPSADGTSINVSTGTQAPQGAPMVSQNNPNAPPVPQRRRMISAPVNDPTVSQ